MNFDSTVSRTDVEQYTQQLVGEPMYFFANPIFQKTRVEFQT